MSYNYVCNYCGSTVYDYQGKRRCHTRLCPNEVDQAEVDALEDELDKQWDAYEDMMRHQYLEELLSAPTPMHLECYEVEGSVKRYRAVRGDMGTNH